MADNRNKRRTHRQTSSPSRRSRTSSTQEKGLWSTFLSKMNSGSLLRRVMKWGGVAVVSIGIFLTLLVSYWIASAPEINANQLQGSVASEIFDRDGQKVYETGSNERVLVPEDEVPQQLFDAVTSIEDQRFLEHNGIDLIRIGGSLLANLKSGSIKQGGSTLTQQLVKLSFFSTKDSDRTYKRKIQEMWMALNVEKKYSKQEIFDLYINKVYLSNGLYGFGTAAKYYYGKELKDLTLAQTALLAGMPQAPTAYDPYQNPENAKKRRDLVLAEMLENKKITQEQYDQAVQVPVDDGLQSIDGLQELQNRNKIILDPYIEQVAKDVAEKGYNIFTDSLKVYTNLDTDAQNFIYTTANDDNGQIFRSDGIQTAISVIDPRTGGIAALFGGRHQTNQLAYNRATSLKRSVGSSIKPFSDYGPAFEYLNYSPGQTLTDEPYEYSDGTSIKNVDDAFKGTITIRDALKESRNIPALKAIQAVGLDNSRTFLNKVGIQFDKENNIYESNAIGGPVTPMTLSAAFATLANGGTYRQPRAVTHFTTSEGEDITISQDVHRAMKDSTAFMLNSILSDVFTNGPLSRFHYSGLSEAGKTGTTNYTDDQLAQANIPRSAYPDHWTSGYTTQYAISVWTGFDRPTDPGNYLYGNDMYISSTLYSRIMSHLVQEHGSPQAFAVPNSVRKVNLAFGSNPLRLARPGERSVYDYVDQELYEKLSNGTVERNDREDVRDIVESSVSSEEETETQSQDSEESSEEESDTSEETSDSTDQNPDSEDPNAQPSQTEDSEIISPPSTGEGGRPGNDGETTIRIRRIQE